MSVGRLITEAACHNAADCILYDIPVHMQGEYCARNPREVLIGCCLAVLILSLGLFRFRVETDPQRLWVGRGSRALADKQAYEVRFTLSHPRSARSTIASCAWQQILGGNICVAGVCSWSGFLHMLPSAPCAGCLWPFLPH